MRKCEMKRKTNETDIDISLCLDGVGKYDIDTGCGFFDHMMELSRGTEGSTSRSNATGTQRWITTIPWKISASLSGQVFKEALGDKKGICRYGEQMLPMDEASCWCRSISGRSSVDLDIDIPTEKVGISTRNSLKNL